MKKACSLAIVILVSSIQISFCQSKPKLFPTSLKMEVGDRVFLYGQWLIPGETVTVQTDTDTLLGTVAQTGMVVIELTRRPANPTSSTNYFYTFMAKTEFSGMSTNFSVQCAPEIVETTPSKIKELFVDRVYVGRDMVTLKADIAIGQLTQPLRSSSPDGPWEKVGEPLMLWVSTFGKEVDFTFSIDQNPRSFFKLATVP